jgi:hypothetical protein
MPKNNSIRVIDHNSPCAFCACGWDKKVERLADAKRALIRHKKYCELGQGEIRLAEIKEITKKYTN